MSNGDEEGVGDLEAAWRAFDEGDLATCLELVQESSTSEGHALATLALLNGGDYARAHERLDLAEESGQRSFDLDFARAELALREWRMKDAREAFERLAQEIDDATVASRLAVLADLAGDHEGADRWFERARALEPEAFHLPTRLSPDEFHELVVAAASQLPEPFQVALEEVQVVIDPMPTLELVDPSDVAETPPDILGLFVGPSDLDRSDADAGFELPPTIYLFQRNLERAAPDAVTLATEIGVTLWHELAHKLGFDEAGVDELGLA